MKYHIICVTTRKDGYDSRPYTHELTPADTAEMIGTCVYYNGQEYSLKEINKGFGGHATVLQLWNGPGELLELYTDTPTEGSRETSESLRVMAYRAVKNRRD